MELKIKSNLPTSKYEKKWQFCVGSCHAATLLRADAIAQLKRVHDELGIKRVRCHGVFNDDMGTLNGFSQAFFGMPVGEHIVETNFYKVGLAYDNLLSIGMQPFVELSFMPELLAADKTRSFIYGSISSMPESLERWCAYLKAFLSYLFHRYGEDEVTSWYFEVWNEPDLAKQFYNGTQMTYFQFYEATARTFKEFCPRLMIGGPSTSASKWIPEFVGFCKMNNVPLDFVSTHQYLGEPFLGVGEDQQEERILDPEAEAAELEEKAKKVNRILCNVQGDTPFLECMRMVLGKDGTEKDGLDANLLSKNARVVKEQAGELPVFYTEWNISASFGSYSHDMRKMAAYDVRTSLALEELVEGNSIWCYSDIFEELHQFKEPFYGGYGMMTYTGIPKPVYHGMRMLAQAEETRILLDEEQFTEVEAAAFEGEKEKQVLLFRQNTKQYEAEPEKVNLSIELMEQPKRVYLQRIDDNHCNPLKVWESMNCPFDLNRSEVDSIMEVSRMMDEKLAFTYEDNMLQTEVALGINDLYFIRIEK